MPVRSPAYTRARAASVLARNLLVTTAAVPAATLAVMPFRLILIDADRRRTNHVVTLEGAPHVGDHLELAGGESVVVHHVTRSSRAGLAGVIIAGTS